jgi:rSAM/selenodomain-associated transferase 2
VLQSEKGRAVQMNVGAKASTGDVLFFLHCDSEAPAEALEDITQVMRQYRAGCFGIAFHRKHFFLFTCRVISNHRVKDRKVMFGDQGIFIDRELFFEAGMFPEIPIMEDYQFSLTLKEMGIRLGMAKHRIYTSDRRFRGDSVELLQVMWKMNRLRAMYRRGVPADELAELYRDVR